MQYFAWFLTLLTPIALLMIFVKQRRKAEVRDGDESGEKIQGTAEDLVQAEERLRKAPVDIRERFLDTMELIGRFPTRQGFDELSFEPLLKSMRDHGIACDIYFQAAGPRGVADSFLVQQGVFEVFAERGHAETVQKLLNQWQKS